MFTVRNCQNTSRKLLLCTSFGGQDHIYFKHAGSSATHRRLGRDDSLPSFFY